MWFLYWKTNIKQKTGFLFGLFMTVLWLMRFLIEFLKEEQAEGREEGFFNLFNTGQVLSIPLILIGLWLMIRTFKKSA